MVWGCIGPNGVGNPVLCERSVKSEYYVQILKENFTNWHRVQHQVQPFTNWHRVIFVHKALEALPKLITPCNITTKLR